VVADTETASRVMFEKIPINRGLLNLTERGSLLEALAEIERRSLPLVYLRWCKIFIIFP
jgi:hypothetical protein